MPSLTADGGSSLITRNTPQLLVMSATGDSIASGGDYVTFDAIVAQHSFTTVTAAGASWTHPVAGVYLLSYEHAWDTYTGGGTIELEIDGVLVPEGVLADGTSGQVGQGVVEYLASAGSVARVKVTQASGSAQTCDAVVRVAISDPMTAFSGRYALAVLADGPIGYWQMGETSGTTALDSSGNGYAGTYQNSPTLGVAGVMRDGSGDSAARFVRGSSQSVAVGDEAAFEFAGTSAFSVEAWFNLDSAPTAGQFFTIVQKTATGTTPAYGWSFLVAPTDGLVFTRYQSAGVLQKVEYPVSSGVDYHAVTTYDGTTLRLYVNGAQVDSDATAISMATGTAPLWIAGQPAPDGDHMNGVVDEVAIYGRALGADEVLEHYTVGGG